MRYLSKKMIWLSVLTVLFLAEAVSAIPTEQWNKTFGGTSWDDWDTANSTKQTSDGGYIVAGYTYSYGVGWVDVWLIKTDASGNELWNKTFGGLSWDSGYSVEQTADGGYIVVGITWSYGVGKDDVWLIKADASGNMLWNKTFGGLSYDGSYSVEQTADGGYILAGYTGSYGAGSQDVWLIKTDANGNMLWNKTFGGLSYDGSYSVEQTVDGGYIIAGITLSYGTGGGDVWLIKTDASGNMLWNKTFGGTNWEDASSVEQTADGGYVVAGYTYSYGAGYSDIWLIKTDASGNMLWNKTFGGTNWEDASSVEQTADGGYIVAGYTYSYGAGYSDIWLIKTDANGNELWNKTFGGMNYDYGNSVQRTSDGGYIVAGMYNLYINPDAWLIKVSGESSNAVGYSATVATGQNTYVQSSNGSFGLLLKGQTKTLNNSVILNNTGDISAKVEARFNDSIAGVFGLISGANLLNASNFALGLPSSLVPLNSSGSDVQVVVAPPGVTALDARLGVPPEQVAGDYSGTVILTFSNSI